MVEELPVPSEDDSFLDIGILKETYNKLGDSITDPLKLILKDGQVISGGEQFMAHYRRKKLKYRKGEEKDAQAIFVTIFIDNLGVIYQIKSIQEKITQLEDLNNGSDLLETEIELVPKPGKKNNQEVNFFIENFSKIIAKRKGSNTSDALLDQISLRLPELRREFGSKFEILFS